MFHRIFPIGIAALLVLAIFPVMALVLDGALGGGEIRRLSGGTRNLPFRRFGGFERAARFKEYEESVEFPALKARKWGSTGLGYGSASGNENRDATKQSIWTKIYISFSEWPLLAEAGNELKHNTFHSKNSHIPDEKKYAAAEYSTRTVFYRPWPRNYPVSEETSLEKVIAIYEQGDSEDGSQKDYTQFYGPWPGEVANIGVTATLSKRAKLSKSSRKNSRNAAAFESRKKFEKKWVRKETGQRKEKLVNRVAARLRQNKGVGNVPGNPSTARAMKPFVGDEFHPGGSVEKILSTLVRVDDAEHMISGVSKFPVPPLGPSSVPYAAKESNIDKKLTPAERKRAEEIAKKENQASQENFMKLRRAYITGFPPRVIFRDQGRSFNMQDIVGLANELERVPSRLAGREGKNSAQSRARSIEQDEKGRREFIQSVVPFVSGWPPRNITGSKE